MPGDEQAPADGGAVDALNRLRDAGGWAWGAVADPDFHIRLMRGEGMTEDELEAAYEKQVGHTRTLLAELARARRERDEARDLLYRMARLIRNTGALPASTWGARGGELLIELREKDPERYNREVKALAASALAASAPAAGQNP